MNRVNTREKRIVVLGASGFIGTRLVGLLSARGCRVVAIDKAAPREILPTVEYVLADVRSPLPREVGVGVDAIYNLAAVHRTPGHASDEYYETNVMGAAHTTDLAEALEIPLVVFTSSIAVYGPSELMVTEQTELRPTTDYGRSKRMAEMLHRKWAAAAQGRRLVIVRPGVIFGPGERGNYTNLARALRRRMFAYPGRRDVIKAGGHVDELLRAIDFAVARGEPEIIFNFALPEESTTADIVRTFSRIAHLPDSFPTLPLAPMLAAARVFEAADAVGLSNPICRERIYKLCQSTRVAPAWLLANGYAFERDLERSLEDWAHETEGRFE